MPKHQDNVDQVVSGTGTRNDPFVSENLFQVQIDADATKPEFWEPQPHTSDWQSHLVGKLEARSLSISTDVQIAGNYPGVDRTTFPSWERSSPKQGFSVEGAKQYQWCQDNRTLLTLMVRVALDGQPLPVSEIKHNPTETAFMFAEGRKPLVTLRVLFGSMQPDELCEAVQKRLWARSAKPNA